MTPANDNAAAQVARLQAAFALRNAPSPREQILALTRLASARVVAPATPTRTPAASPSPRLTSQHLRVA